MINGVQANLGVTRISCHQNLLCFVNLPFFSLLSHYSYCNLLSINVHMLVSALILCEKLQPWKLKCFIFSLCSCALYPDFTLLLCLGGLKPSAEYLGHSSFCYLRNCCWGANFISAATQTAVGSGWIPVGQTALPSPASQQWWVQPLRSRDGHLLRPLKGQENAT